MPLNTLPRYCRARGKVRGEKGSMRGGGRRRRRGGKLVGNVHTSRLIEYIKKVIKGKKE